MERSDGNNTEALRGDQVAIVAAIRRRSGSGQVTIIQGSDQAAISHELMTRWRSGGNQAAIRQRSGRWRRSGSNQGDDRVTIMAAIIRRSDGDNAEALRRRSDSDHGGNQAAIRQRSGGNHTRQRSGGN